MQPLEESGTSNLQYPAHRGNCVLMAMLVHEAVLHLSSLVKYRAALYYNIALFFKAAQLGSQSQEFTLGFEQLTGLALGLLRGDGLHLVEAVGRYNEARGNLCY